MCLGSVNTLDGSHNKRWHELDSLAIFEEKEESAIVGILSFR